MYDYLIVGSGLYGSIFAYEAQKKGKKVLVLERRNHIGGNIYTEVVEDINIHKYGAHIFHTSNEEVWFYVNQFAEFNNYINSPIANYKGEIYNLPFNMNTFSKMWGITRPNEALRIINEQKKMKEEKPQNLEEQAISLVGTDIYEKLIKGYTEKQWGRKCHELPAAIINRLPVRFTYDNNYFNDKYQGIPKGGYTKIIEQLLDGCEVQLEVDYLQNKEKYNSIANEIIFTGAIDEYYDFCYGELEYRSVKFETEIVDINNYQGNAVVNYTDSETEYTRIIEHKHFEFGQQDKSVISKEYSKEWNKEEEPYYPINDEKNSEVYRKYKKLSLKETKVCFGGRLGLYKYYDMDKVVLEALNLAESKLGSK